MRNNPSTHQRIYPSTDLHKMKTLKIVKIGGQVINDEEKLQKTLEAFTQIQDAKILVHGGGKEATEFLNKLNIKPNMIAGRRITDADTIKVVQMVYAGLINTNIVAKLQSMDCQAIGLSGSDANCILAEKRPVTNGINYGFVGDITKVNASIITMLLKEGLIPVFCALTHDRKGQVLNTNADTITAALGVTMSKSFDVDLIYCFEKNGVLTDIKDANSQIKHITSKDYNSLKENKIISDGMIPKIDNAFSALNEGVKNVFITHYNSLNDKQQKGTRISL